MFQQMQSMAQKQVLKLFLSVAIHTHNYKFIYIYVYMYTYIMHRVHICIYIYMCVYHSHFDRRSLRIFNTHMCKYVLTLIICLLLLVYFTCIRTYTYALTLIAAHCSVSSSCLQVACSYCTASGFTFRPVCRAHA